MPKLVVPAFLVLLLSSLSCADNQDSGAEAMRRPRSSAGREADDREPTKTRDAQIPAADASGSEAADASSMIADSASPPAADGSAPMQAEAGARDASGADADAPDASTFDAIAPEAQTPDAMTQTPTDSGMETPPSACEEFVLPADCAPPTGTSLPAELRCTGLYANFARRTIACGLVEYTPAFELWSDGAGKRRWVSLPAGTRVDTSDPDAFIYPVGTQFWKEFAVEVAGVRKRAETRLLRKLSAGWVFTTYVWNEGQTEAKQMNDGVANWAGSGHTVPTRDHCLECHAGRADRILGWDAVLLGEGARGIRLTDLAAVDALDDAGVEPAMPTIPGDAVERDALGYLHVNCGVSCHNPRLEARARDTAVYLQLATGELRGVLDTPAVASTLNREPTGHAPIYELPEPAAGPFYDLLPGSPERSLLLGRMRVRNHPAQMPPIASNRVDERGVAIVSAWIEQMTPARGYPLPAE